MTKDNYKTDVIFRKEKDGSILAVFPYLIQDFSGLYCTCYAHVGQHSAMMWNYLQNTAPASPQEYSDLFAELESIGYNLRVIKRRNFKKYQKAIYLSLQTLK